MKIGFDGKRAFQNKTGLGNYSRSLVTILAHYFPGNEYVLFAPKTTSLFPVDDKKNISAITPTSFLYKKLKALWRRSGMVKDIAAARLDIFHGLSNELPKGIEKIAAKKIVTIHDLIFERYPETYNWDERYVHRWKIKHACKVADTVIAISEQTKNDLIELYKVPAQKIVVAYQSCHPQFEILLPDDEKQRIKKKYSLPDEYFLFVSSIAPRKNLLLVCKALFLLKEKTNIPLVVIGDGKKEKEEVKAFLQQHNISNRVIFLNEKPVAKEVDFITAKDFPAIYQSATAFIYPSLFEGFGLPILEALWSKVPVVCSNVSSMPEVAGDAALYIDPKDEQTIADQLLKLVNDEALKQQLITKGYVQAQKFSQEVYAKHMMDIYKNVL